MLNPTEILIDAFSASLRESYHRMYGGMRPEICDITVWAGRMALENIANGDGLYHNVEHTMFVTQVGQAILNGKHVTSGGVSLEDWLHVSIALLCHDIGYNKGVCEGDRPSENIFEDGMGGTVSLPPGSSNAALEPFHINRGRTFIMDRFAGHKIIDAERVSHYIGYTQFPVPQAADNHPDNKYAELVRSADLIGQLGDPNYLQKLHALYFEFEETGANARMGFENADDLRRGYPAFYWNMVYPHVIPALGHLEATQFGKNVLANLYANVFREEHRNKVRAAVDRT